ncbi:hypothetical protein K438DRAFT_1759300 [Mycena galopus ATCC 62051]|nr:hypothetical protein K438DRAFT_1759300 [Mycena galopus ATCC 62051]
MRFIQTSVIVLAFALMQFPALALNAALAQSMCGGCGDPYNSGRVKVPLCRCKRHQIAAGAAAAVPQHCHTAAVSCTRTFCGTSGEFMFCGKHIDSRNGLGKT